MRHLQNHGHAISLSLSSFHLPPTYSRACMLEHAPVVLLEQVRHAEIGNADALAKVAMLNQKHVVCGGRHLCGDMHACILVCALQ